MSEGTIYTHDVFVSHSSHDKTWADAACAVLERNQIRCWIAPRDIIPGDEWGAAIISGINKSRIMVLIFSGHANDSPEVRREVDRAISRGMNIMPIRIEDVRPEGAMEFALSNTHWLDAFTPPAERHLEKIARSVRALLDQGEEDEAAPRRRHASTPDPEAVVNRRGRRLALAVAAAVGVLASVMILVAVFRDRNSSKPNLGGVGSGGDRVGAEIEDQTARRRNATEAGETQTRLPPERVAPGEAAGPKSSSATAVAESAKKSSPTGGRIIYASDFVNNRSGLSKDLTAPPDPNPGVSDGAFYIYGARRFWRGWDIHRFESECTCEVVGRVTGDHPSRNAAWSVLLLNTSGSGRGIRVNINLRGELFVTPNPWPGGKAFVDVDPRIGPVTHPAIKPGGEYNNLLLIVRKREIVIVVNGSKVAEPVRLQFDLTPAKLQLGNAGPGNKLAEFDRVEIRELADHDADKPKVQDRQPGSTGGRS